MAFSSCLGCQPWISSHNPKQPFLSHQISQPTKVIPFPFSRNFAKPLSFTVSSGPSNALLSPDFTSKQLLDILRHQDDKLSALRLFQWASKQPKFVATLPMYEEILQKLGNAGSFDSIRHVLDDLKLSDIVVVESTFFILIDSYVKFELYDEAVGVLDVMKNEFRVTPRTHTYNSLYTVFYDFDIALYVT